MNIASKRTIVALSVLIVMELVVFGGLASTGYGATIKENTPALAVSDTPYDPPVEEIAGLKKAAAKTKNAAAKSKEATAKTKEVTTELEATTEPKEVFAESDTASEEATVETEAVYNEVEAASEDVSVGIEAEFYQDEFGQEASDGYEPSYDDSGYINANVDGTHISGSDLQFNGVYYDEGSGYSYTYYSENVLPGGGLEIPGRHVDDEGYVCDEDGNICVASDDLSKGTVVSVPFGNGTAVVYDSGSGYGNLDIYTSW